MHDTHTQKAQANQHQETTPERERERETYLSSEHSVAQ
jgi:hypothetical protein